MYYFTGNNVLCLCSRSDVRYSSKIEIFSIIPNDAMSIEVSGFGIK